MTSCAIPRPAADEFTPYYGKYIAKVPDGDLCRILTDQLADTLVLIRSMPEARGTHRYAPGKLSIKEVLGHVCDSERIFSYRALRIARGDATPLPGFEQDDYVVAGHFESRTLKDLAAEFSHLRQANLLLFGSLDEAALLRKGQASGADITVRSLVYLIAGHERHHIRVLQERYL